MTIQSDLEFVDQSSSELKYGFYDRPLDLNEFNILAVDRWQTPMHINVNAYILGASHAIELEMPSGHNLTEIFSCAKSHPEGSLCDDEKTEHFFYEDKSFVYEFGKWNSDQPVNKTSDTGILYYQFPDESFTMILAQFHNQSLMEIRTTHSYPRENTMVKSKTFIRRKISYVKENNRNDDGSCLISLQ